MLLQIFFFQLVLLCLRMCHRLVIRHCIYCKSNVSFPFSLFPFPQQEKLFHWILRQQEEGSRVTAADIVAYLQNELEYGAEESPVSPRLSLQQHHPQTATQMNTLSAPFSSTPISPATTTQGVRSGDYQAKNSVFSNALSSPVRRSLQHYHSVQGSYHSNNVLSSANGPRNNENNIHQQNREASSPSANDCMDMHADSPGRDFPF
ncbi:hypothetical protein DITRI_Ditri16bG0074000 [Diplodiscus trichospermus]